MTTSQETATSSGTREPAPGGLALVQDFINTWDLQGADRLGEQTTCEAWFAGHKLIGPKEHASHSDVRHATEVREALRSLLAVNDGGRPGPGAVETLSRAARSAQLAIRFEPDGSAQLEPATHGIDAALGKIVGIAFRSIIDGSWKRLKMCRDETCRWAFYDRSKNRSGGWCSMSVCGNRNKARRFRGQKGARRSKAT